MIFSQELQHVKLCVQDISKVKQKHRFYINVRHKNISSQLLQSGKTAHSLAVDASFWAITLDQNDLGQQNTSWVRDTY